MRKLKPINEMERLKSYSEASNLPRITLDLAHIPEAKDWKIGETYEVDMVLKMTGISQNKYSNSAEFDIVEIEPEEEAPDENDSQMLNSDGGMYMGKSSTTKTPSNV